MSAPLATAAPKREDFEFCFRDKDLLTVLTSPVRSLRPPSCNIGIVRCVLMSIQSLSKQSEVGELLGFFRSYKRIHTRLTLI